MSSDDDPVRKDLSAPGVGETTTAHQVRQRHEDRLMSLLNVVGVDDAADPEGGTGQVVVYVTRKAPIAELNPQDVVPRELDGVRVRVEEIGFLTAHGEKSDG